MSHQEEEPEPSYENVVKKFQTFGNLENAKRAFVARDYEKFEQELKLAPYQFFRSVYNAPEDFDGSMQFIVANFVSGLVKELEDYRKYFFVVHRCVQPSSTVKHYVFESLWILNAPSIQEIYGSRCDDFTFTSVDMSSETEVTQFLLDFRHQPVPEEEDVEESTYVAYEEEPYDPFSFGGGYDDEEEETTLPSLVPETTPPEEYEARSEQASANVETSVQSECSQNDTQPEPENVQLDNIVVEIQEKLNVLISEQYLH